MGNDKMGKMGNKELWNGEWEKVENKMVKNDCKSCLLLKKIWISFKSIFGPYSVHQFSSIIFSSICPRGRPRFVTPKNMPGPRRALASVHRALLTHRNWPIEPPMPARSLCPVDTVHCWTVSTRGFAIRRRDQSVTDLSGIFYFYPSAAQCAKIVGDASVQIFSYF